MKNQLIDVDLTDKLFSFRVSKTVQIQDNLMNLNRPANATDRDVNEKISEMINELNKSKKKNGQSISIQMLDTDKFRKEIFNSTIQDVISSHAKSFPQIDIKQSFCEATFDVRGNIYWDVKYFLKSVQLTAISAAPPDKGTITIAYFDEKDSTRQLKEGTFSINTIIDLKLIGKASAAV